VYNGLWFLSIKEMEIFPASLYKTVHELDTVCLRALWSKQTVRLGRLHHRLGQPLRFSDIMAVAPEGPRETLTRASQAC